MTRIGPNRTKILLLILQAASEGRHETIRSLGAAIGIGSPNGVMCHLKPLRQAGLITWDSRLGGTIRPTCKFIPADRLDSDSPHETQA